MDANGLRCFRSNVSKCDFLLDRQKERLMAMLDGVSDGDSDDGDSDDGDSGNGFSGVDAKDVVDNVFWRLFGYGVDSLGTLEQLDVRYAIREVCSRV